MCYHNILFILLLLHTVFINGMHVCLSKHRCFSQLPKVLQGMYKRSPQKEHLEPILEGLANKQYPNNIAVLVWCMVRDQHLSFQTADKALNLLHQYFDCAPSLYCAKPMPIIEDSLIDWEQEFDNKVFLIKQLNCKKVRVHCLENLDDEYSIALQEFVYVQKNPQTTLTFLLDNNEIEHAAVQCGCKNHKALNIAQFIEKDKKSHQHCDE